MTIKQQVYINESSKNMHDNIGNVLSLQDAISTADSPAKAIGALQRHGGAASGKVQYLGKWQSSIFMWAVTGGKAGFSPLQLLPDVPLFEYIVGEYADEGVIVRICKDMANHPAPARQLTWRRISRDLSGDKESVKRYKKELKQDIALMRKLSKEEG